MSVYCGDQLETIFEVVWLYSSVNGVIIKCGCMHF